MCLGKDAKISAYLEAMRGCKLTSEEVAHKMGLSHERVKASLRALKNIGAVKVSNGIWEVIPAKDFP